MKHLFRRLVVAPLGVGVVSSVYFFRYPRLPHPGPADADNELFLRSRDEYLAQLSTKTLLRSLLVHSFCTHPRLVDLGIEIMKGQQRSIPILDSIIRHTFFAHFCGYDNHEIRADFRSGETIEEAVRVGMKLNSEGIVPLLGYSKESSDSPIDIQNTENEIIRCIEEAKRLQKPVFVAIKLSGLSPDEEIRRLEQDIDNLVGNMSSSSVFFAEAHQLLTYYPELFNRLKRISDIAKNSNVYLVLDAEIRFQGKVDSLPTSAVLCSLLNSNKLHVWNTHQMYSSFRLF